MAFSEYSRKLLALSRTVHTWLGALSALDESRRERVAHYADEIAATLARTAEALARLECEPQDRLAARAAAREFGRIAGYVATLVGVLSRHLDGRKLAGVKRRLEQLEKSGLEDLAGSAKSRRQLERLVAAEGYFRALADALRV